MVTSCTLTHPSINSGSPVKVLANQIRVAWKNNTTDDPPANGTTISEVQTESYENPVYSVQNVHFSQASGTLTYAHLLTLAKLKYDGTNPIYLTVTYGSAFSLVGSTGTSPIKVIIKDFSFPIDLTDSKNGYLPIGSFTLEETA